MPTPTYDLKAGPGSFKWTGYPIHVTRDLALDPGGPFFEYVLTYLCASAGLTAVYDAVKYPTFMENTLGVFPGFDETARMDLRAAVLVARDGTTLPHQRAEQRLCCMLANTAYESLKRPEKTKLSRSPVGQYFRHVRNAASHDNKWHFSDHEPSRPAEWGGFKIDPKKGKRNPLQGTDCIYGTLRPANLLYLLRDVEKLLI